MVQGGVFIVRGDFISILSPRTVSGGWSVPPDTIRDAADHIPPPPSRTLKPVTDEQVFYDKFSYDKCTCLYATYFI